MIRKRMKALTTLLLASAAVFALVSPQGALAEHGRGSKEGHHGRGMWGKTPASRILDHRADLGLTEDQVKRLEAAETRSRDTLEKPAAALREERRAFFQGLDAGTIDRAEMNRRIDAIAQDLAALDRTRMLAIVEAREILTPDQRAKLREMRQKWHEKRAGAAGGSRAAD